ncbi:uncharacterized protein B0I36DRAFT_333010, partial [Microdochium trichocladiopsis]
IYRQIAIGITEKHVIEIATPFNRYDDLGPNASINAVFAWQSSHRPIQRATTYGLDGAFPSQLQPALIRIYEWASFRWHEFLHQPSRRMPPNTRSSYDELRPLVSKQQDCPQLEGLQDQDLGTNEDNIETEATVRAMIRPPTRPPIQPVDKLVYIDTTRNVTICLLCRLGIKPGNGTVVHFRGRHSMKGDELQDIRRICFQPTLVDPFSIPVPDDNTLPLDYLPILRGFSCTGCRFLTISNKNIRKHWRATHWKGIQFDMVPDDIYSTVQLQSFGVHSRAQYWIVKSDIEGEDTI